MFWENGWSAEESILSSSAIIAFVIPLNIFANQRNEIFHHHRMLTYLLFIYHRKISKFIKLQLFYFHFLPHCVFFCISSYKVEAHGSSSSLYVSFSSKLLVSFRFVNCKWKNWKVGKVKDWELLLSYKGEGQGKFLFHLFLAFLSWVH